MKFAWRILCYHDILPNQVGSFCAQLSALRDAGWTFCSMSDGLAKLNNNHAGRWMTVTFDDGSLTTFEVAMPALVKFEIPACLYVTTDYVRSGQTYRDTPPRPAMTWDHIRAWRAAGNEVGSHTHTHASLPLCTPDRLREELLWSKRLLEDGLGETVDHFSYPWGEHTLGTLSALQAFARYRTAATVDRGNNKRDTGHLRLHRDQAGPGWSVLRLRSLMLLSLVKPLYVLQRTMRYPRRKPAEPILESLGEPPASQ
jgi:peptidoglycan/xylan/chitin deacetylase (PgdA/CDA1 family)